MKKFFAALSTTLLLGSFSTAHAVEPTTVELLTLPFGTSAYSTDMAMESLFKELKSPVSLMLKQTPGAMFITRYKAENIDKIRSGKLPFTMTMCTTSLLPYIAQGLTPYEKYPDPDTVIIAVLNGMVLPFVTYDEKIKSPADFIGKKVGVAEKARPNQSTLPNQPVFDVAYGGYDKVDWQYLGFTNSKDALLNGSIDVHMGNGMCTLNVAADGSYYTEKVGIDPAMMEVISAGKPFYLISEDPEVLKTAYDPAKNLVHFPVLIKAGAIPGQTKDVWAKAGAICYAVDKDMPDDVVEEIVYQMYKNKERLATYYEGLSYMSDSPYIEGMDPKSFHPGVFKAMKRLGLPLPEGVEVQ